MSAFSDTVRGMSKAQTSVMLVVALVMIVGFIIASLKLSTGSMAPLYTGLSLEDSSKIVAELEKSGTPYQIVGNGSEILVPSDRVLRMRMNMAGQGLPSGGSVVGYEIFDRSESFGSSNMVMSVNIMRALEGELARTISSLTDVENARVHLVMPKRELFTRDKDKPSASVTVKMRGGKSLERSEVTAITHLVAAAVPGLEVSRVAVVDGHGRLLARGDGDSTDMAASNAQEYKAAFEAREQQELEDLLEKVIGAGKVRVQVAADINFDRTVTNSEKYDPDGQVARSVQSNSERDNSQDKAAKENVSVTNNLPQQSGSGESGGSSTHVNETTNETTNYEISKIIQNHVSEGGTVNKISVAVLVDGTYSGEGEGTYTPRTEEELKQVRTLVASSIGFDEKRGDKIEVVNMRFTKEAFNTQGESFFERFKLEMQSIIQTLIIAIVAILAILLVLRPAVNQLIKQSQSASARLSNEMGAASGAARLTAGSMGGGGGGLASAIGMPDMPTSEVDAMIDVANIKGSMKSSSMKKVNEIVEKYPEETMNVLRNWVTK